MYVKFVALLACVAYMTSAAEEDVKDLVDSDFDSGVAEVDTTLVMFYAPW